MSERRRTSLRPCGIENMATLSEAERSAATRFQRLWRIAALAASLSAFDYARPKVDGGFKGSCDSAHVIDAQNELVRVREYVGARAFLALKVAAGEEGSMNAVAAALGAPARMTAAREVKKALRVLADFWSKKSASAGIKGPALPDFTNDDGGGDARLGEF